MAKESIVTAEGYEKLKSEIEDLSGRGRREIAERIKEARDFGDIAENAEYDAAKNDQAMLEGRIATLEERVRNAVIVDEAHLDTHIVSVGTTVHLKDQKTTKSVKYKIVGSSEADPLGGKLSSESPIGKALLGHKRNDIVKVPVPRGPQRQLKITKIEA
ncbi:MAG: transcription elongation factor GreA [Solirubrobacterales bacterium]